MHQGSNLFSWTLLKSLKKLALIGVLEASLAVTLAMQIKRILAPDAMDGNLLLFGVSLFFVVLALGTLKWRERVEAELLGQDYVHTIRLGLFDHLSRLSFRVLARKRKGPLLLRFMNDLTALRQWVTIGLARLVISSILLIIGLSALFFININIALALTALFLLGGASAFLLGTSVNASVRQARKRRSILASGITEKMLTMPIIQILARRQVERRDFQRKSRKLKTAMRERANFIGLLRGLTRIVSSLALILTALVGALGIQSGQITTGDLLAAIALVTFLSPALYDFGRVYEYWHGAQIAQEKIDNLLNLGPLITPPSKGQRSRIRRTDLQLSSVEFSPALSDITVQANPGDKIALLGVNGSGKSTLLQLIMRLDEPQKGQIMLGGKSLNKYGIGSLRRTITLASASDPLFKGTIEKNLCYASDRINIDASKEMLLALGMDVDNPKSAFWRGRTVREGGANLSRGEVSAIVIARAFLMRPKILLLDEVDVHLDKKRKAAFYKVLEGFESTIIAASHDLSLLALCNKVWQLENGKIQKQTPAHYKSTLHTLNVQ